MEIKVSLCQGLRVGLQKGVKYIILVFFSGGVCMGVPAKLGGADMKSKSQHNEVAGLKGWKVTGNKIAVKAWEVGGKVGTVVVLEEGAVLKTKLDLPAITEREQKLKGKWKGVLSVDTYGVISGVGERAEWNLEIVNVKDEVVYSGDFETKGVAVSKSEGVVKPQRVNVELDSKLIDLLMTADFQLKLSVKGQGGVVFGGLEVVRLHEKPTAKLEAKPNGQSGPDKVNVGSLGFQMLVEHGQRVCSIYNVKEGGAAAEAGLEWGDVLVGVNGVKFGVNSAKPGWDWYDHGHASTVGRAILGGLEGENPSRKITLDVLRNGEFLKLSVNLPDVYLEEDFFSKSSGSGSGDRMKADMLSFLLKNQKKDGSFGCPIRTTFATLSLLSEHDEKYAEPIFRAVNWMLNKYPNAENFGGLGFWHASYAGILYCEYYLATGDERVLSRIQGIHDWVLTGAHTSKWGMACLGHGVNGLPYGNKALMGPTSHLLVFDGLARRCGVEMQLWETLMPYTEHCWSDPKKGGHGSMGYNASYKDKAQFWSRTGQCALACAIRGERTDMQDAMTGFMRENYPFYRNSHAYGEPGGAWGILSLGMAHPEAYREVMNAYRWEFALSWEPGYGMKFSQPHMGAPYMGQDDLLNAAYPLVFNAGKKTLQMTGGNERDWLDVSGFEKPLSNVVLRRSSNGEVWLECRIPGNRIFYTLDGTEPNEESTSYTAPFSLSHGGKVKAVSLKGAELSEVTSRKYSKFSRRVAVVEASGHFDSKEAVRKASYVLDGAKYLAWIPDLGEGAQSYPHYIVFDLGAECKMKSISFSQGLKSGGVGRYKVSGWINDKKKPVVMVEGEWKDFSADRLIGINSPLVVRFVRVDFLEPLVEDLDPKKKNRSFRIQEMLLDYELIKELPQEADFE